MKTADLIEHVAAEHGVAKEHTKKILESALAAVAAAARAGEEVTLAGFGRFKVTERAERQGRNPATGETITIAASKKLTFVAAKNIRDAMNTAAAAAATRAPAPVESSKKRGSLSQKPSPKTSERKGRRQGRIEA
jgi:DNA-binding protein HU-beta